MNYFQYIKYLSKRYVYFRVDSNLNAVKGGGACHLREKVLAEAAKMYVVIILLIQI